MVIEWCATCDTLRLDPSTATCLNCGGRRFRQAPTPEEPTLRDRIIEYEVNSRTVFGDGVPLDRLDDPVSTAEWDRFLRTVTRQQPRDRATELTRRAHWEALKAAPMPTGREALKAAPMPTDREEAKGGVRLGRGAILGGIIGGTIGGFWAAPGAPLLGALLGAIPGGMIGVIVYVFASMGMLFWGRFGAMAGGIVAGGTMGVIAGFSSASLGSVFGGVLGVNALGIWLKILSQIAMVGAPGAAIGVMLSLAVAQAHDEN